MPELNVDSDIRKNEAQSFSKNFNFLNILKRDIKI